MSEDGYLPVCWRNGLLCCGNGRLFVSNDGYAICPFEDGVYRNNLGVNRAVIKRDHSRRGGRRDILFPCGGDIHMDGFTPWEKRKSLNVHGKRDFLGRRRGKNGDRDNSSDSDERKDNHANGEIVSRRR